MEYVKLEDVVDIYLGLTHTPTYVDDGVPFLSVKDISDGKIIFDKCHFIKEEEYDSLPNGARPKVGDMLFCRVGTIGKPVIIEEGIPKFGAFVSLGFLRNKNEEKTSLKYLLHWMNSELFFKQVRKNVKGASQVNLNTGWLSKFVLPAYSLDIQNEIVCILDKITDLIDKRKQQLSKLDELVKARFVELFGTPLLNEKGWGVKNTGDVCSVTDGSHFSPVGKEEGYPMLSVRNMRNDGFHYDDCKLVSQEDYDVLVKQGCKPLKNDVLIAKDGSYFYYGFVVKEEIEQAVLSSIAILRPNLELINPEYLCRYMLSSEIVDLVGKNYVTGAAIKRVILKGIKQIPVMLPPIELQNQFAAFVEQTDKSKLEVQKSLEKLELLKKALMQKYFG